MKGLRDTGAIVTTDANIIVEEFYRVYLKEEDTKDETKPFKKSK